MLCGVQVPLGTMFVVYILQSQSTGRILLLAHSNYPIEDLLNTTRENVKFNKAFSVPG